jgi:hypothetical protein
MRLHFTADLTRHSTFKIKKNADGWSNYNRKDIKISLNKEGFSASLEDSCNKASHLGLSGHS